MKVHRWDDLPSSKVSLSARLAQMIRNPTPRVTLMLGSGGLLLLLVALWTSFYTVDPHERAVVTRFGEVVRIAEPGLHFKWPLAIERVRLVSTERVLKQEFGIRTKGTDDDGRTEYEDGNFEDESLMLTGDLNLINAEWVVQYRIADPIEYLYAMREPERALRDTEESIMRRIVGNRIGSEVLTEGRVEISATARDELHTAMKQAKNGLHVVTVELQDVVPHTRVKPAFNDVNEARQERFCIASRSLDLIQHFPESMGSWPTIAIVRATDRGSALATANASAASITSGPSVALRWNVTTANRAGLACVLPSLAKVPVWAPQWKLLFVDV